MKKEKQLNKLKKQDSKIKYREYIKMRKRIKNSSSFSNVKEVNDDGLIHLKTGEVACLFEIHAIDLSLTSNQEKLIFFNMLKVLYQIPNLNIKCYKLDEKLNLKKIIQRKTY